MYPSRAVCAEFALSAVGLHTIVAVSVRGRTIILLYIIIFYNTVRRKKTASARAMISIDRTRAARTNNARCNRNSRSPGGPQIVRFINIVRTSVITIIIIVFPSFYTLYWRLPGGEHLIGGPDIIYIYITWPAEANAEVAALCTTYTHWIIWV